MYTFTLVRQTYILVVEADVQRAKLRKPSSPHTQNTHTHALYFSVILIIQISILKYTRTGNNTSNGYLQILVGVGSSPMTRRKDNLFTDQKDSRDDIGLIE